MHYIKYSLTLLIVITYSCKSDIDIKGGNTGEIDSIKIRKYNDSVARDRYWNKLLDSLQLISIGNNQDLTVLYESLKSSVFSVYTFNDSSMSQGSAFLISSDGTCLSNYHVFEGADKAYVINHRGDKFLIDKIINYDTDKDVIIFQIGIKNQFISPLLIANESPKIGEDCFAIGSPMGLSQTLSTGIISGFRDNGNFIQTTAEITHGSSGGALFNKRGEVIGITTLGFGDANLNFAINIKNVDYPLIHAESSSTKSTSDEFIVTSDKAFFYDQPDLLTKRKAYMVRGDKGIVLERSNGFTYIMFTNYRGQTTKGWLNLNDISFTTTNLTKNSYYKVQVQKAYFYEEPNDASKKSAFLTFGDSFICLKTENEFIYTVFTNRSNQRTEGWIRISDAIQQR
jgi:hypothetical protein